MESRWRVEELSEASGLSVDTIRYYQKRRLLPPPVREGRIAWYGPEHRARLRDIRRLQADGWPLAVIGRILAGAGADAALAALVARREGAETFDRTTLAARAGVTAEIVDLLTEVELIGHRPAGYTAGDVELVRLGITLVGAGIPLDEVLKLARRYDEATRDVAEEAVAMFDRHIRRPILAGPGSAARKAARLAAAFDALYPAVTGLVSRHFGRVLLDEAQEAIEAAGGGDRP